MGSDYNRAIDDVIAELERIGIRDNIIRKIRAMKVGRFQGW